MTLLAGTLIEVETGRIAAGGGCVAHAGDGRVVFVRHSLPGELVQAVVTQETSSFLRADAVEVLRAAPGRVEPPCAAAGPGRCGGCDFQHVAIGTQRELKADLITEQLRRIAKVDRSVVVEGLPGRPDGLGWRSRVRFAVDHDGRVGLRRHRSHDIEPLSACPIASSAVESLGAEERSWPGVAEFEVFAPNNEAIPVVEVVMRDRRTRSVPDLDATFVVGGRVVRGPGASEVEVHGRRYRVSAGVFWQVHTAAAEVLVEAVLDGLEPSAGERALDLYAGAGLFSAQLGTRLGPNGHVLAVERDARACADATVNTADQPWVEIRRASVTDRLLGSDLGEADLVVADPSREGIGKATMQALLDRRPLPRRFAYVACDPAAFARDLRVALDAGWQLSSLRAFDLFPMTEHIELVAMLEPGAAPAA